MILKKTDSEFLHYIVTKQYRPGDRLPPLSIISEELSLSVGKLREQLQVARSIGLVSVKPRDGIRIKEYSFMPATRQSLLYALGVNHRYFESYSALRVEVEAAFFEQAAALLTAKDHTELRQLLAGADAKLSGRPIQIPHAEHRQLHLLVFRHLDNPFVLGILEAYWEAYESIELNIYADYRYLREVWAYHTRMVDAIVTGEHAKARGIFVEHTKLLRHRIDPDNG